MLRTIKFRAWDKNNKRMGFEDLTFAVGRMSERAESAGYDLMQFTGLLDKNGKEIYEDDIVYCGKNSKGDVFASVLWDEVDGAWCSLAKYDGDDREFRWHKMEVVGNVYESPELLKRL